jgi:outer membrane protein assembly factor BamA
MVSKVLAQLILDLRKWICFIALIAYWPVRAQNTLGITTNITTKQVGFPCSEKKSIMHIFFEGNNKTNKSVLLREMNIHEGDSICVDSLDAYLHTNYLRLYNLNIFSSIHFKTENTDNQCINIYVQLKEQWLLIPQADIQLADRNINVWWTEQQHSLSRVNVGLYVQQKNLSGHLDNLSVTAHLGYTQQFTTAYSRPYIDQKQKQGISAAIGYSRSKELAYTTLENKLQFVHHDNDFLFSSLFLNASYMYRSAYRTRHIISAGFNRYTIGDTINTLNPHFFENNSLRLSYIELGYRYEYNGVDNWNYPRNGIKMVASVASRWGIEGMHYQAIGALEFGFFKQLHNRWYGTFIFRGKTTLPQAKSYFLQSAMGYKSNSVRGYEYYVVDAAQFGIGRISIKYEALRKHIQKLPFRYLPELPVWIYPKVFFDAGYAQNNFVAHQNGLSNTLLYSIGLGVDIITAYDLKLRIEFALNHLGENGLYLHANSE